MDNRNNINNSKIVSIVGPGGSGKTQLSYKAIHRYQEEGLFDIVVPIYLSKGIPSFSGFLAEVAQKLGISVKDFDTYDTDSKKGLIFTMLENKKNPLLYLDNFETISDNSDISKDKEVKDLIFFFKQ